MQHAISIIIISCAFMYWLIMFVASVRTLILGIRSKTWPTVDGEIITSELTKVRRSETGSILNHYRTVIQYKYKVNDVEYMSSVISFFDLLWGVFNKGLRRQKSARHIVEKYPAGAPVKVYVNPNKPKQTILEPGISDPNFILLFAIFLVIGFLVTIILGLIFVS